MKKILLLITVFSFLYPQCIGDVNDDYAVDVQDVLIMINTIIYDDEINDDAADINDDGNIDVLDIISVVNIILYENNNCTPPIEIICLIIPTIHFL